MLQSGLQTPNSGVLKIDNADSLSARYLHGNGEDEFPGGGLQPRWRVATGSMVWRYADRGGTILRSVKFTFSPGLGSHLAAGLEPASASFNEGGCECESGYDRF